MVLSHKARWFMTALMVITFPARQIRWDHRLTRSALMLARLNWKLKGQTEWATHFAGHNSTPCRKLGWTSHRHGKATP
jgi:hypothetical protein